ncbi:hypothetical protein CROQUDRAFT_34396, partial [Cronartium quercuum f. sp. fusiforme G11]
ESSIQEGVRIPVIVRIATALELSSERVNWEKLGALAIENKVFQIIEAMAGNINLGEHLEFQVFVTHWTTEYSRYFFMKKHDKFTELFNSRLKYLGSLADRHQLYIQKSGPDGEIKISTGEALIATHVGIPFELIQKLNECFKSTQNVAQRPKGDRRRICGVWTDDLPHEIENETLAFKHFFNLRHQNVHGL